jgi:hypothetical protein
MKIEISEKGSEAFYREVVNISAQYRYILKNHHHKLKDYFTQIVKLGWDNIAVVRADRESLTFVSGDRTGIVISVAKQYAGEIPAWLHENQPKVEVVNN